MSSTIQKSERRHYLDNIRWVTVCLVVIYHAIYMYNGEGINMGAYSNNEGAHYQDAVLYLLYPWFMLILFIVSGISARIYLEKHTIKEFVKSRTDKLLVPSTLGLFVWGWAQGLVSMKMSGFDPAAGGPEGAAIPGPVIYFIAVLSGQGVLWFAQLLWMFCIVLALVRKFEKGKLYELCAKTNVLVLISFVVPLYFFGLFLNMPMVTVYRFGYYGFGFFLGYFVFAHEEVIDRLKKLRFVLAPVALALGITYTVLYFRQNYGDTSSEYIHIINSVWAVAYAWTAILSIFTFAKVYGDKETKLTAFMRKKSFGLYVFHMFPMMAAAYAMHQFLNDSVPLAARYIIVAVVGVVFGFALPEIFGRIPIIRYFVLGIRKPKAKKD